MRSYKQFHYTQKFSLQVFYLPTRLPLHTSNPPNHLLFVLVSKELSFFSQQPSAQMKDKRGAVPCPQVA